MRITKQQLAQLIKEELGILLNEQICAKGTVWDSTTRQCVTPRGGMTMDHVPCDPNNPSMPCDAAPEQGHMEDPQYEEHSECPPGQVLDTMTRNCVDPPPPPSAEDYQLQESPKKQQVREAVQKAIRETLKSKK